MASKCKELKPQICGGKMIIQLPEVCYPKEPSNKVCEAEVCKAKVGCN